MLSSSCLLIGSDANPSFCASLANASSCFRFSICCFFISGSWARRSNIFGLVFATSAKSTSISALLMLLNDWDWPLIRMAAVAIKQPKPIRIGILRFISPTRAALIPQDTRVIDIDRPAVAEKGDDDAEADGGFGGGDRHHHKDKKLPG